MKNILAILLLSSLIFSCNGSEDNEGEGNENGEDEFSIINPPFEGDFQNDTIFQIDPTQEVTVVAANGSSIEIPANSIVDADGNPITDPVSLSFTQYHSAADIMASGIPMQYDSAGVVNNFESAGMFTLSAKANDKKVYVKDGEKLTVNLASDRNDAMNFYELDPQNGDWTYEMEPSRVDKNPFFDPASVPIEPQKRDKNAFVLDFNFDLSDYQELDAFKGIVWEYVGDHDSLDPRKNNIVSKIKWTDFTLEPTYENAYEYYLTMHQGALTHFTTKVKAALQGADFDSAMSAYNDKRMAIADKKDAMSKPFIRSVEIGGFATYNYDYIHSMRAPNKVIADFEFDKNNNDKASSIIFVFYPENEAIINYPADNWDKFAVDKESDCTILAIMPDNKLAVHKNANSVCYDKESYTFQMRVLDEVLDSKSDLEKIIASL